MIINGGFAVNQRATWAKTDNIYTVDRWRQLNAGTADPCTLTQDSADVPTGAMYAAKIVVGANSNAKFGIFQIIEGINCVAAHGQTVTLSAQFKATAALSNTRMGICVWTGTMDNGGTAFPDPVYNWNASGTNPDIQTATSWSAWGVNGANTPASLALPTSSWTLKTVTSGTISASATNIAVFIWSDATSTTQTTDILSVANVQLEVGATATTFENRSIATETALCRRYCQRYAAGGVYTQFGYGQVVGTTTASVLHSLDTPMRRTPTSASGYTNLALTDQVNAPVPLTGLAITATNASSNSALWAVTVGGGLTQYRGCSLICNNSTAPSIVYDAEL